MDQQDAERSRLAMKDTANQLQRKPSRTKQKQPMKHINAVLVDIINTVTESAKCEARKE